MRKILITGGSGDIGNAIVGNFRGKGEQVFAPTRQEMDLMSMDSIDQYMQSCDVDVFVHCAGINFPKVIENIVFDDLMRTMQINAFSFYKIAQHVLKRLTRSNRPGYILGISSIYGRIARKGRFSYASSKHCLIGMVKSLAMEYGQYNIMCNTLSPGFVDTRLTRQNNDEATLQGFANNIPVRRLAKSEDIAEVAYFLCSEQNRYINGEDILADGGYTMGGFQT